MGNAVRMERLSREGSLPLHVSVRRLILEHIHSGALAPGDRVPSEPILAESLGVSRMTINKALVSLAAEGWVHRVQGAGTFVSEANLLTLFRVGIVMPEEITGAIDNYYFGALYFGLIEQGAREGLTFEPVPLRRLIDGQLESDGFEAHVLINPPRATLDDLAMRAHAPVVLGASWPGFGATCIDSDNIMGALLACAHLSEAGHRRLLFVGACPNDANSLDRARGFTIAGEVLRLEETRLAPWSLEAIALDPEAVEAIRQALRDGITGVVAGGAILALHVMNLVAEMGLRVPSDVSLVGYDDPSFLAAAPVPLTTIAQPLGQMVERTIFELNRLRRRPMDAPAAVLCPPELVQRASVAAPRPLDPKHS